MVYFWSPIFGKKVPMSLNEIVDTLKQTGSQLLSQANPKGRVRGSLPWGGRGCRDVGLFRGAYLLGSASFEQIALANKIAGRPPTKFAPWAQANVRQ